MRDRLLQTQFETGVVINELIQQIFRTIEFDAMLIARNHLRHEFHNLLIAFRLINTLQGIVEKILEQIFDDLLLLGQIARQDPLLGNKRQDMVDG